jgi:hypothetical protein
MNKDLNAAVAAGRATGAMVVSGFGTLWMVAGLSLMHRLNAATLSATLIVGSMLGLTAGWLLKRTPKRADGPEARKQQQQIGRRFGLINGIQWTACAIAVILLNVFRQTDYIAPVIAIIVGLHFFPLASLFHNRTHYVKGTAMVLWAAGSMLILRGGQVSSVVAIGAGTILLLSAVYEISSVSKMLSHQPPTEKTAAPSRL